jgi:hypothetical protein
MKIADALKLTAIPKGRVDDAPILLGIVSSLTPGSGLYSYQYVVDNRRGQVNIQDVIILVDSVNENPSLAPNEHAEPQSWTFEFGPGQVGNPPASESGTFWYWSSLQGVPVGTISPIFSFVTDRAPTLVVKNNFILYTTSLAPGQGVIAYGHIIAPDFGVPFPPESPEGCCGGVPSSQD